jgi:TorA maturation chaperone TorD
MATRPRTTERKATQEERRALVAQRAFARAAVYRLLSQSLVYPSVEALHALRDVDLPAAVTLAPALQDELPPLVEQLGQRLDDTSVQSLRDAHRRVFPHVDSGDCPSHETAYTAQNIFQETEKLSDLAGFFRAFGLELAEHERLDHIGVELEFMYVLTYKEGYALLHHGREKARLCRIVQRKFMEDHLGCWAPPFAELLARHAGGGHLEAVAALTEAFLRHEVALLRARPEVLAARPVVKAPDPDDLVCPLAQQSSPPEPGGEDAPL